jgi:hypothetical protein
MLLWICFHETPPEWKIIKLHVAGFTRNSSSSSSRHQLKLMKVYIAVSAIVITPETVEDGIE